MDYQLDVDRLIPSLRHGASLSASGVCAAMLLAAGAAGAAPTSGDAYQYRLVNGYNQEVRGQVQYRVDKVDAGGVTVSATPDTAAAGVGRTEVYTPEGNYLRRALASHGQNVEYVFASPYPAYAFPLEVGKSWSVRVNATVPGVDRQRSVRVDGTVLGRERIRVPAGEFDTFKVRRIVWPGDGNSFQMETKILEYDWYAPALGRSVRSDSKSEYFDRSRCGGGDGGGGGMTCMYYGDWDVYELVSAGARVK